MRFSFYNLRIGILTHIVFLIVSSMLLIHVVMIKLSERDLIRVKMQTGRLLLNTVAQEVGYEMANRNKMDIAHELMTHFKNRIVTSLVIGGFSDVLVVNSEGSKVFALKSSGEIEKECLLISSNTWKQVSFLSFSWKNMGCVLAGSKMDHHVFACYL